MTTTTLAASGIFSLLIALTYAYVGLRLSKRTLAGEAEMALNLFGLWWFGLAGSTVLSGLQPLLVAGGVASVPLFTILQYVNFLVLTMGLLGLVYYLLYLFLGKPGLLPYITIFYVAFFLAVLWVLSNGNPTGIETTTWDTQLVYAQPLEGPVIQVLLFLLIGPPLLAAGAYLSLYPRVTDSTQRYRILLVGASILLWFGSAYGASLVGLAEQSWWGLVSQFIGLAAALTILAAYLPPGWIQNRFDVHSLETGAPLTTEPNR